jgi:hypothetical protein
MPLYELDIPNFAQCEHIGFVPSQRIFFFRQGRHLQRHGISISRTRKERGNQGDLRLSRSFSLRFLRTVISRISSLHVYCNERKTENDEERGRGGIVILGLNLSFFLSGFGAAPQFGS